METKKLFTKDKETIALAIILVGTLFSGSLAIFAKFLSGKDGELFSSYDIAFTKFFVAAAVFGIVMIFVNREEFKIKLKDLWLFFFVAAMNVILSVTLFEAMNNLHMPIALSTAIQETNPYFTVFFAYFLFKEKITLRKITAICVAFIGCLIMAFAASGNTDGTEITVLGLVLVVVSAITVSMFFLGSKRLGEMGYSSGTTFFYVFLFSAVLMLLTMPLPEGLNFGNIGNCIQNDNSLIIYALCTGVVATLIPKFLFIKGVQMADAGKASVVLMFDLVTSAVYAQIILGQDLGGIVGVVGILMIMFSVAIIETKLGTKFFRDGEGGDGGDLLKKSNKNDAP